MHKFLDRIDISSAVGRLSKAAICFIAGFVSLHLVALYGKSILLQPHLIAFSTYLSLISLSILGLGLAGVYASSSLRQQLKRISWRVLLVLFFLTAAFAINFTIESVKSYAVLNLKLEALKEYQEFSKKYSIQIDENMNENDTNRIKDLVKIVVDNGCAVKNEFTVGSVKWARYTFDYIERNCFR